MSLLFLRSSLIYLGIGMAVGALLLAEKGLGLEPRLWLLLPVHVHIMLVGWLAQFAMGVGYWMFPRFGGGAHRGRTWPAGLAYCLLNLGLLVALVGYLLRALGAEIPAVLFPLAGALEGTGAVAYTVHAWPRIKPLESIFGPPGR